MARIFQHAYYADFIQMFFERYVFDLRNMKDFLLFLRLISKL